MDGQTVAFGLVIAIIVAALIFDYVNGFHDAANSIATVVATRVLSPGVAVAWAAFFNFVAFLVFGTAVAKTIGGDMVNIAAIPAGDQLYVLGINGVLAAHNVRTGERVYQARIGSGGSFSASPVAADGKLYIASEDGDIFVVKAGPSFELLATNAMGQVIMATPAISTGTIIVRGLKDVFAIGLRRGN